MGARPATDMVTLGLWPSVEAAIGDVVALTPPGRLGEVADMADAVVFLASDAGRFITGTGLAVDGEWVRDREVMRLSDYLDKGASLGKSEGAVAPSAGGQAGLPAAATRTRAADRRSGGSCERSEPPERRRAERTVRW